VRNGAEFIHVMLRYVTAQYPVTWLHVIGLVKQLSCLKWRPQISFLLGPDVYPVDYKVWSIMQEKVYKKWIKDIDELWHPDSLGQNRSVHYWYSQTVAPTSSCMHALKLKADTLNTHCVSNVFCWRNSIDY